MLFAANIFPHRPRPGTENSPPLRLCTSATRPPMPIFLQKALAYLVLGLIVSIGLVNAARRAIFLAQAQATTGEVIALRQAPSKSSNRRSYFPIFRFTAPNGETITVTSNIGGKYNSWLGKPVPVLYLPANPQEAHIRSFGQLWESSLVPSIVGGTFSVIPVLIFLRRRNPASLPRS